MLETGLLVLAVFTVGYTIIAQKLSPTVLTAPMLFIALGYLLSLTGLLPGEEAEEAMRLVAEIALVVLLFSDAAQIDLKALERQHAWPQRMLLIRLPLGTMTMWGCLPDWTIIAIVLAAAILAPTDAALGQAVVTNPLVPKRARRALTFKSGLKDGLALPAILLFASLTDFEMG